MKRKLYIEYNIKYFGDRILSSDIREATKEEIESAKNNYKKTGKVIPQVIYDVGGPLYDERRCGITDKFLGFI